MAAADDRTAATKLRCLTRHVADEHKIPAKRHDFFSRLSQISSAGKIPCGAHRSRSERLLHSESQTGSNQAVVLSNDSNGLSRQRAGHCDFYGKSDRGALSTADPPRTGPCRMPTTRQLLTSAAVETAEAYLSVGGDKATHRVVRSCLSATRRASSCSAETRHRVTFSGDCKQRPKVSIDSLF